MVMASTLNEENEVDIDLSKPNFKLTRKFGHPWHRGGDWDLLEMTAPSIPEMEAMVKKAESKFWQVWIKGVATINDKETPACVMYKPSGAMFEWEDNPSTSEGKVD